MRPSSAQQGIRLSLERLEAFATDVLKSSGMSRENAELVARIMVDADRNGISSHGVTKLPTYLSRVDAGVMALEPPLEVESETVSSARLNAGNGFGQIAASQGMQMAIRKAEVTGIGIVSVAHSNHFGVAGYYAREAATAGKIGIAMTNASPAMAPFNGSQKLLGTNPIAFGIPAGDRAPVVLDMSSSMVARGRIRREIDEGATEIPPGWANDPEGRATTDPFRALQGSLAPVGGAKGAGLALVVELLTGALSDSAGVGEVANLYDTSRPANTAHTLLSIDPSAFMGRMAFEHAVEATLDSITSMPAVDGTRVMYPGLVEERRANVTRRTGVVVSETSAESLNQVAERLGLPPLNGE